ncbi:MAG: chemotaxis response regulator protein-glutamate methylesterase, partial [Gammaproteobacteria bacterium]|nr:chemotaxis response regulator protein-glutamate methylesterase [Gammaproteobacteria bacterium]
MIKVLIVDDSSLIRQLMTNILSAEDGIEVVGSAKDPYDARDKIKRLNPDVITLDVEMPKMDGITFLRNLMRLHPLPVVMVSTMTNAGAGVTLEALELGAVDYVSKPNIGLQNNMTAYADEIVNKVKSAARANIKGGYRVAAVKPAAKTGSPVKFKTTDMIIAIGASTGGTEAIKDILFELPSNMPGIVISQHIPATFSSAFAERLNQNSAMSVSEASEGRQILPGHVYIAPGGQHLQVNRSGAQLICHLDDGAAVNRHKPSVEVMFKSVAANVGSNALCVLLTGMGDDGADAMGIMRAAGATTIAQDEQSSVVWGMPGEAVKRGHVDEVVPLH